MESRVGNSNGSGNAKRPRSLALKALYESGDSRDSGNNSRKRKSSSVSKSSVRNENGISVEVSSGTDVESDRLDSFPLALNGAVLCIPKRKRSVRCGGSQEPKPGEPSSGEVDTAKLNGNDTLKGPGKDGECGNVQLKSGQNANEGDGLVNFDGTEAQADSFKGLDERGTGKKKLKSSQKGEEGGEKTHCNGDASQTRPDSLKVRKKSLEKSKGSRSKQLKLSQKADGEKSHCNGDALGTIKDSSKDHKKSPDKSSGSGNIHVKLSQKENVEETKADSFGIGNCSKTRTDSSKVHEKKDIDKVNENINRQLKSNRKETEDGKGHRLANDNGSKAWTNSVKVRKKKGLDKGKGSGNKNFKSSHSSDEEAGRTNRLVGGDCSGTHTVPLKVRSKKSLHKGKEIKSMQLNSSQNAEEEAGRTGFLGASNAESTMKKAKRKHGKAKGLQLGKKSVANKARVVDDENLIEACNKIDEDDEENLEENAARMLSSRFDPSCTGFSSSSKATPSHSMNGLSFLSTDHQLIQGFRSSAESESASFDAAGTVLRPGSLEMKGLKRKRRHYYEMSTENMDPFWILNRCIKIYWPLDESWYSGFVDNYDKERKLHHVKYVDRDEEWINLRNERFKLLLLPSEAPGKAERRRSAAIHRTEDKEKGNVKTHKNELEESGKVNDSHGSDFRDSDPIISWLPRSSHRVKTSSRHTSKKQKTNGLTPLSGEARGETLKSDISNMSSEERPDELGKGKKCILDSKNISKDGKVPIVYFRRRFHKPCKVLSNASEGSSSARVEFEHITSRASVNKLGSLEESDKNVRRTDCHEIFRSISDAGMLKFTLISPESVACRFDVSLPVFSVLGYAFAAQRYRLLYELMLYKYGTVMKMNMWPRVHLEMLFVDNTRGLSFYLFQSCLQKALALIHPVLILFGQPSEGCKYIDLELPVTSIQFKFTCVRDHRKQIVFALYNFSEVSCKEWTCLEYKLWRHCLLYGQLPLSECTFDNIKALQNVRHGIPPVSIHSASDSIEAERGGSSMDLRRFTGQSGFEQFVTEIPINKVGLLSGKCGETVKKMQAQSRAYTQGTSSRRPLGDTSTERTVPIEASNKIYNDVISERFWRRSRRGLPLMGTSRESVSVGHFSNLNEMHKKLPLFALSFTAAPTFFRGLHLKLLMERKVPLIPFQGHCSLEHQEISGMVHLCSRTVFCHSKASDATNTEINLETMSKDVSSSEPELNALGLKSSDPLTAVDLRNAEGSFSFQGPDTDGPNDITEDSTRSNLDLESSDLSKDVSHDDLVTCSQIELETADSAVCGVGSAVKSSHFLTTADQGTHEASSISQDPEKSGTGDNVLTESKRCGQIELNKSIVTSKPSVVGEKSRTGSLSSLNSISIEIPSRSHLGSSGSGELHCIRQSIDCSPNSSVGIICSPNPTAPRSSSLHRNRSSSSFRYSSHGWSDSKADILPNGFGNRPKKPRTQVSYALPFGDIDLGSRSRSHLQKGLLPRRTRRSNERRSSDVAAGSERNLELLSCEANVLITDGDRGRRVHGALVVLELFDHNEWKLAIKVSGVTKYSYKAHQFLQPGSTNRYTHAMMWKGGKDWTLEFPDRSQWALFKEMHEECYSRNVRAAMVKNIPIPGVRLLDENVEKGAAVPYVHNSFKYFHQEKTDVELALDKCRILYDMDTDDEQWLKEQNSTAGDSSTVGEISEELFEKIMDMFEKLAYTKQHDQFPFEEIQGPMNGIGPIEIVKAIYYHWQQKRQQKGMPLIRHFQPALWEIYQQQMREWEQAVNKRNYTLRNGHQAKSTPIEKPPMFAFCLKPRGLEVPIKDSKHRSQKKISVSAQSNILSGEQGGYHAFGKRSNGFIPGEEKITYQGHYFESLDDSPREFSPREVINARYYSTVGDRFDVVHSQNLNRRTSKKIGTMSPNDPRMFSSYGQRMIGMRNGIPQRKVPFSKYPPQQHYQSEVSQKYTVKMVEDSELDELRRQEAARCASSMARFKRERAQRLLSRADLLVHKAAVSVMTAEAIKAASESSVGEG